MTVSTQLLLASGHIKRSRPNDGGNERSFYFENIRAHTHTQKAKIIIIYRAELETNQRPRLHRSVAVD